MVFAQRISGEPQPWFRALGFKVQAVNNAEVWIIMPTTVQVYNITHSLLRVLIEVIYGYIAYFDIFYLNLDLPSTYQSRYYAWDLGFGASFTDMERI